MFGVAAVGGVVAPLVAPALERRLSMKVVVIGANEQCSGPVDRLREAHLPE
ncbi:hypothetical protein [Kitasatospora sp. NPDC050543]|uniref:hypothetical protein n=1 Tax=Kitasatospora sp. NPDC050543 TaxID=3364054 RepID=UPI0037BBE0DD